MLMAPPADTHSPLCHGIRRREPPVPADLEIPALAEIREGKDRPRELLLKDRALDRQRYARDHRLARRPGGGLHMIVVPFPNKLEPQSSRALHRERQGLWRVIHHVHREAKQMRGVRDATHGRVVA